jgi:dihydroorotase
VITGNYILKNALDTTGNAVEVVIESRKIVETVDTSVQYEVLDCTGLTVLPGFVDLHTHLREPGFEQSETVLSGSRSAAAGGYTAIHAMANTFPVADTAGVVEQVARLGEEASLVHVQPIGAVTVGLKGEQLAELGAMAQSKARVRVFSDDGSCIHDPSIMRRALEYVKAFDGVIAQHAQEPRLTVGAQMNEGALASRLGLSGWPAVAEEAIIARDILLTELTGSRLHVCHVSTSGSVELIRQAKRRGINVTTEVTPHHLLLTEDLAEGYDPIYKVNPPLRTRKDVEALRMGLVDGTIDVVATDHAPHPKESKDTDWNSAAFGMVGLETAYSITQQVLIDSGESTFSRLAEVMSINGARIGGLDGQGSYLASGAPANLTLVDPAQSWVASSKTHSLSENSPYVGLPMKGRVKYTIFDGEFTYRDGQVMSREQR